MDSWIQNAKQFATRQLLLNLKDSLTGIYNMYIVYVCVVVIIYIIKLWLLHNAWEHLSEKRSFFK